MKKYIVKYKECGKVFGEYSSNYEAEDRLMDYFNYHKNDSDDDRISPFDYELEEVE